VVFNPGVRVGEQALKNRMNKVLDLTREVWSGRFERRGGLYGELADGYTDYTDAIPILFTTLPRLQRHGPLDAVWWRCGHRQWETLSDALANPDDIDAWHQGDEQRREQRKEREEQARQAATWDQNPAPSVDTGQLGHPREPEPAPPAPCERCGLPITGEPGIRYDYATPEDGRHCPPCRADIAREPASFFKALFGRDN